MNGSGWGMARRAFTTYKKPERRHFFRGGRARCSRLLLVDEDGVVADETPTSIDCKQCRSLHAIDLKFSKQVRDHLDQKEAR